MTGFHTIVILALLACILLLTMIFLKVSNMDFTLSDWYYYHAKSHPSEFPDYFPDAEQNEDKDESDN